MALFESAPERGWNSEIDSVWGSDTPADPLVIVYRRRELEQTQLSNPRDSLRQAVVECPERTVEENKPSNLKKRGCEEVAQSGKICHNCRNRREHYLPCSRCSLRFCARCLRNRHGEDIEVEQAENVRWVCPKCRGGCGAGCLRNCCNCSTCRKSQHLEPTGQMHKIAINHGFDNVHDYLIHLETQESAAAIARRKEGRGWTSVDGGIVAVAMEPGMEQQQTIPGWEKKNSRSRRWLWKNLKWEKNTKSSIKPEVDPFMLSQMRLLLSRHNSSWELGRKFERKYADWQKVDEILTGKRTVETEFPVFRTEEELSPEEVFRTEAKVSPEEQFKSFLAF